MKLAGKAALVTGGGRGIGKGCALALAKQGADVAVTYRKDEAAAKETVAELQALGRKAVAIASDVSQEDQVAKGVKDAIAALGRLDILICNAGIASRGNLVHDTTTEEMRRVLDTHVMGSFWCVRESLDALRASGDGRIVLISSIASKNFGPRGAPYSMAKVAMDALMRCLSKEEGPHGIRVNCIGPGLIETEMGRRLTKARTGGDIKELYDTYPFGRVGQPEDIGELAAFLCTPEGGYISGQIVYVDGGGFRTGEGA